MKSKKFILAVAALAIVALGLSAFSFASAQTRDGVFASVIQAKDGGDSIFHRGPKGPRVGLGGELGEYVKEAAADILGVRVEDLDAAKADGTTMEELLANAGLTQEEFRTAMEAALPGILEQAVADEVITQEQADAIAEHGFRSPKGFRGPKVEGPLHEYIQEVVADTLGVTVEDLEAAKADSTSMEQLLENAGITREELKEAVEAALPDILDQAVEDGVITQENADNILENGFPRLNHRHGPHGNGDGFQHDKNGETAPAFFGQNG